MAAIDTFHEYNSSLTPGERETIKELLKDTSDDLLAARSEDARLRIVDAYIKRVKHKLGSH